MAYSLKTAAPLTVLALAAAACSSSGCLDNGSSIPLAGFYSSATGAAVSLDSLRVSGLDAPADSAVVRPGAGTSSVYLPLRPAAGSTSWIISYKYKALDNPALNDTVTFVYESIPYFASAECGAMYSYRVTDLRHTSHLIDSVRMTSALITNADIESIRIYFRMAAEEPLE